MKDHDTSSIKKAPNTISGFTLLETMVALAIMMIAFSSILLVESRSLSTSAKAKQMNVVGMLARNEMIKTEYEIEGKTFDEVRKDETGQFEEPFKDYTWSRSIKELKFPALNVGGGGKAGDGNAQIAELLTKLVTNFFSKAMREVIVTIKWKRGSGTQSFTVSTYWVDLNHEFQLQE